MTSTRPDFSNRLSALPTEPGVYLMKDHRGEVIYVGKAAALRNRVRSYFQSTRGMDPKTRELVTHIVDFEVIRTDTRDRSADPRKRADQAISAQVQRHAEGQQDVSVLQDHERGVAADHLDPPDRRTTAGAISDPTPRPDSPTKRSICSTGSFPTGSARRRSPATDEVCLYYHMHQCLAPCIAATDHETYLQAVDRGGALPQWARRRDSAPA